VGKSEPDRNERKEIKKMEKSFDMCFDWFSGTNQNIAKDVFKWYLIGFINAKIFYKKHWVR